MYSKNLLLFGFFTTSLTILFSQDPKVKSKFILQDLCNDEKQNELLSIEFNVISNNIESKSPFKVRQDGQVEIYLSDVNLFLYNVSIKETQSNVINNVTLNELPIDYSISLKTIDVSDLIFQDIQLKMPSTVEFDEDLLQISKELQEIDLKVELKNNEIKAMKIEINQKIDQLYNAIEKEGNSEESDLDNEIKNLTGDLDILQKDLLTLKNSYTNEQLKEAQVLSKASNTSDRLLEFKNKFNAYKKVIQKLYYAVMFYNDLICLAQSNGNKGADIVNNKKILARAYFDTDNPIEMTMIFRDIFPEIQESFDEITNVYNLFTPSELKYNNVENAYIQISKFNTDLQSKKYVEVFQAIRSLYESINESNYRLSFSTNIISDDADVIKYKITCIPKSQLECSINPKTIEKTFEVRIAGGTKIDFSAGLFNNFALNDHTYRLEAQSDSTTLVIENTQQNLFLPSLGGLIHVYRRGPKDLKIALSTGVSITQEQKAAYYFGASILSGRSQRFILSFGFAGKQVATAKDNFKNEAVINKPIDDIGAIEFVAPSPFRIGGFLGLSFNLTSKTGGSEFTNYLTNQ